MRELERGFARCLSMHRPGEHDPEPDRPDPLPGDDVPDQPIDEPPPPPGKQPPVTARSDRAAHALLRARRIGMIH